MNNLFIIYYLLFISNSTHSNLKMSEKNAYVCYAASIAASIADRFNQDSFDVSDPEMVKCHKHETVHHCTVSCDECLKHDHPEYYGGDVTKCNN